MAEEGLAVGEESFMLETLKRAKRSRLGARDRLPLRDAVCHASSQAASRAVGVAQAEVPERLARRSGATVAKP
jgi:hypothetical protein